MKIKDFIIHRIDKKQHSDPVPHLRNAALDPSDPGALRFTEAVIEIFKAQNGKPSSVFADFNTDTANYPFSEWYLNYCAGREDFVCFTKKSTSRLANCMAAQQLSTGGCVVFSNFEADGITKFLVVMVHPQDGLSITEDLNFAEVNHLELKQIDKAALITAPQSGAFPDKPVTYAGFRKEMSRYFQEFIGPDAFRQPTKDTARLLQVVENYARSQSFDDSRLDEVRIKLRQYARECPNQELDLQAVSAVVNPTSPSDFAIYASNEGVSAFIKPDQNIFKRWRVIRHKSNDGLMIQFKAETVGSPGTGHRLILDQVARTLTITQLEAEFVQKIAESKMPPV